MRRFVLLPLALVVVVLAAYAGYWFYFAHRLRAEIGPWAEARRAEGYDFTWQAATVDGFPGAFRLHVAGAAMQASRPIPYTVGAAEIVLTAAPWNPSQWRWSAPQGARVAGSGGATALQAASAEGTATASAADGTLISVHASALSGRGLAQGLSAASIEAQLSLPARPPSNHLDPALALAVALEKLTLPVPVPSLGPQIDTLALTATVKGNLPPGPLDRALAAWRDGGGTIEVESARLVWGAVRASVNGTIALDDRLQPAAAMTATIERPDAIVDAAVASGNLQQRFAALVKTILGALAKPDADGQPVVTVPVSLQDQRLFLGPAPVATLPPIVWE